MPVTKTEKAEEKKKKSFGRHLADNLLAVLWAWGVALLLQLTVCGAYQVPSQSMMPSIFVGDIMMTEKLSYGNWLPVFHVGLPAFARPERNAVAAFVTPEWKSPGLLREIASVLTLSLLNLDNTPEHPKYLVKRVVGVPGDRLRMINARLIQNGVPVSARPLGTVREPIKQAGKTVAWQDFDLFEEKAGSALRVVQHLATTLKFLQEEVYAFDEIVVPRKGVKISLTNQNAYYRGLLKLLVERESGKTVDVLSGHWYLDQTEVTEWKPREDYFFMMGDNRDFSYDSRYWGFVPESLVFGRPLFRYFPFSRAGLDVNEKAKTALKRNFGK